MAATPLSAHSGNGEATVSCKSIPHLRIAREAARTHTEREREQGRFPQPLSELHLPACTCIFTRDVNMHHTEASGVLLSLFLCLLQMLLCDMGQRWIVFPPGNPSSCTYVVALCFVASLAHEPACGIEAVQ